MPSSPPVPRPLSPPAAPAAPRPARPFRSAVGAAAPGTRPAGSTMRRLLDPARLTPPEAFAALRGGADDAVVWAAERLQAADAPTRRAAVLGLARRFADDRRRGVYWSPVHDLVWSWWAAGPPDDRPGAPDGGDAGVSRALARAAGALDATGLTEWVRAQAGTALVVLLLAFDAEPVHDVALHEVPTIDAALVAAVAARCPDRLSLLAWRVAPGGGAWVALEGLAAATPAGRAAVAVLDARARAARPTTGAAGSPAHGADRPWGDLG